MTRRLNKTRLLLIAVLVVVALVVVDGSGAYPVLEPLAGVFWTVVFWLLVIVVLALLVWSIFPTP